MKFAIAAEKGSKPSIWFFLIDEKSELSLAGKYFFAPAKK